MATSKYFKKFRAKLERIPGITFKEMGFGFYRIFWKNVYVGECYGEMTAVGYDKTEEDVRFMNKSYYEEYEDTAKTVRTIKNFFEGYYDNLKKLNIIIYKLRNDSNFRKEHRKQYSQFIVK